MKRIEEFKRSVELKNRAMGMADDARAKAIDDKVQERAKFKGWGQDYRAVCADYRKSFRNMTIK